MNPLNREASEALIALSSSSKFSSSHKTPAVTQSAEINMFLAGQPAGINVSMPHGQGMKENTEPMIESLAIPYDNDQLADPDLWDGLFAPVWLLRINKFLSCDAQNITCLLLKIHLSGSILLVINQPRISQNW